MRKKRIMLVDDNPSFAEILSMNLGSAGYEVIVVGDGLEALNKARNSHPDLILLDLMLPRLDGHKVCKLIKMEKDLKIIPVIMVTSRDTDEDRIQALKSGADGFIAKPAEVNHILSTIARILNSPDN